jgi:hypothetical protein
MANESTYFPPGTVNGPIRIEVYKEFLEEDLLSMDEEIEYMIGGRDDN